MQYRNYKNGKQYFWIGLLIFLLLGGFRTFFLILPLLVSIIPLLVVGFILMRLVAVVTKNSQIASSLHGSSVARNRYVELLVRILVLAVKADGTVDPRELQTIYGYFSVQLRYTPIQVQWVRDLVDHALKTPASLNDVCREFATQYSSEASYLALELVYQIMHADGHFSAVESTFIQELAQKLQIRDSVHQQIRARYVKEDVLAQYYKTLGVSSGASAEEIKAAYKAACKQYHPDKVQHLGEEFRQVAEEKIKHINLAYSELKKKHG